MLAQCLKKSFLVQDLPHDCVQNSAVKPFADRRSDDYQEVPDVVVSMRVFLGICIGRDWSLPDCHRYQRGLYDGQDSKNAQPVSNIVA